MGKQATLVLLVVLGATGVTPVCHTASMLFLIPGLGIWALRRKTRLQRHTHSRRRR